MLGLSVDPALGVVLPALYQSAHPANGDRTDLMWVDFGDGAFVEYAGLFSSVDYLVF